ncbi:ArsR/SmtB family transcription factor [Williamsia sterculiae]|uniref:Transcriptional regulator, ArsR family n=1 Tax=Williamsia sterculiae TaxID=1344003 RepID=A0A1N7CD26_9NOCA|nr:helix-turn-helix domain-containing protein [Williamsia sterculiae]SIR61403.1 transcriptional regulator, ArsR family [Williamsia sterculiae]
MLIDDVHPDRSSLRLTTVFATLADPVRMRAAQTLARVGELDCTRLQNEAGLNVSRSTFSHHQKVLREAGIIQVRVRGARRLLSLRSDDLDARFPGLLALVLSAGEENGTAAGGASVGDNG